MDNPKVYVTQIPARLEGGAWVPTVDISPAAEHGDVKILLPSGMNFHASSSVVKQLREGLRPFRDDVDFLLPLGDPLVMVLASALLGKRWGSFQMLKWDRFTRTYAPILVDVL